MTQINASIVLYHNKKEQLIKAINSFLNTDLQVKLYLADNSLNSLASFVSMWKNIVKRDKCK